MRLYSPAPRPPAHIVPLPSTKLLSTTAASPLHRMAAQSTTTTSVRIPGRCSASGEAGLLSGSADGGGAQGGRWLYVAPYHRVRCRGGPIFSIRVRECDTKMHALSARDVSKESAAVSPSRTSYSPALLNHRPSTFLPLALGSWLLVSVGFRNRNRAETDGQGPCRRRIVLASHVASNASASCRVLWLDRYPPSGFASAAISRPAPPPLHTTLNLSAHWSPSTPAVCGKIYVRATLKHEGVGVWCSTARPACCLGCARE